MIEEPKSQWERAAPLVVGAVIAIGAIGVAAAYFAPQFWSRGANTSEQRRDVVFPKEQVPEDIPDTVARDVWIEWDDEQPVSSYRVAGFEFSFQAVGRDDLNAARMRVVSPDGVETELVGQEAWSPRANFAVVKLDASQPDHQVLFSSFSGGAHCCTSLTMLELKDGAWRATHFGQWDGDVPAVPTDLDGDGIKEFTFVDQAFLYAFESYAGSWAPTVIKTVRDGRVVDVSDEARFRSIYRRELPQMREACGQRANGACAAFVATSARVGEIDQAWSYMLSSYDQYSDWSLPTACRVRTADSCPAAAEYAFETYPEALQWFLGELGYIAPTYVEPLQARGPSFSCGAARTGAEQAICASTTLSALDRLMARAYTRAYALTPDRGALRASQRDFLSARNVKPDPYVLEDIYRSRIQQLAAI